MIAALSVLAFFKKLPLWVYAGLGVVLLAWFLYDRGLVAGEAKIQARWNAAIEAAKVLSKEDRDAAEKAIPQIAPGTADIAPGGKRCRVRDNFDRDCIQGGKLR